MTDPMHYPYTTCPDELREEAIRAAEQSEPETLPEIVRDVQAGWPAEKCCECQASLEHETTIHLHQGNAYCSRCYHAENA